MKKSVKKVLAVFLSIVVLFSVSVVAFSADNEKGAIVLYTNDIHCATENYAVFAAYRSELISQGYDVVTVDGGDAIQGEIIGTFTQGSAIVQIMNSVGYDYAIPGNHEFDYGMDNFLYLAEDEADYEYMSCNFTDLIAKDTVFEPYYIEEINGEKVAFLGISTPETYTKSTPVYFQDEEGNYIYSFSEDNFYETIQRSVDKAIAEGAERVVAVGHLGIDGTTDGWKSTDVIKNTTGIDVLLDAHAHQKIEGETYSNKDGEDVLLCSTYTKFDYFAEMTLNSDGTEQSKLINPADIDVKNLSEDAQTAYEKTKNIIDGYNEELAFIFEKLGTSDVNMYAYDDDKSWLVRRYETNMGDFCADAYLAGTGADIAFANGGGVRSDIRVGDVTRKMLMDINPWNNAMCVIEVTGKQIVDALEHGACEYPEASGGFLQVSGLTYEINAYVESPVIKDSMGNFVSVDESKPHRVVNVKVGGKDIELDKTYNLAGNAYNLTQGGDGFTMFNGAKVVKSEGLPTDAEMLINYFTDNLGGKLTSDKYGNKTGDGRIVINTTAPAADPAPICRRLCHSNCPVAKLICSVLRFICQILDICDFCSCGAKHW